MNKVVDQKKQLQNSEKCIVNITLLAPYEYQLITWNNYIDKSDLESYSYELIIGKHQMLEIGINICFSKTDIR